MGNKTVCCLAKSYIRRMNPPKSLKVRHEVNCYLSLTQFSIKTQETANHTNILFMHIFFVSSFVSALSCLLTINIKVNVCISGSVPFAFNDEAEEQWSRRHVLSTLSTGWEVNENDAPRTGIVNILYQNESVMRQVLSGGGNMKPGSRKTQARVRIPPSSRDTEHEMRKRKMTAKSIFLCYVYT